LTADLNRASPTKEKVVTEGAAPVTPSVAAPPVSEGYTAKRQTEAERKAYLESDKQAEIVEEGRVRCRKCQTWIILSNKQTYSTGKWVKHKSGCSDILCVLLIFLVHFAHSFDRPSNRVAAAKRKLLLVNDPQAKSFDTHRVQCTYCSANVALQGEGDYNLTMWDEHKAQCSK
jgi:DNA-directed RNA polymerase subunit RPC12/RpoP